VARKLRTNLDVIKSTLAVKVDYEITNKVKTFSREREIRKDLFIAQGFDRIRGSGFYGLETHCQQGDHQGGPAGDRKYPDAGPSPVGKILQPCVHGKISRRPGDDVGHKHPFEELPGEQIKDPWMGCAQNLADADFFCPGFQTEAGQAE
jgi:hypothetical protein